MLKMPGNVRIEEQGDSWFLVWDPVPDAESYHFSQPAPYVTKMTSVNINTCKGSTSDHLLITFCGVTAKGEIGEAFTGFMALPEEKKVAIVVTKKQWNLWVWLAKFKPSLPKFKNPFKPLPSFPSFKLPSVKIDWSRFKWKQKVQAQSAAPAVVAAVTPIRKRKNWIVVNYHIIRRKVRLAWKHRPRPVFKLPSFKLPQFKLPSMKVDWDNWFWKNHNALCDKLWLVWDSIKLPSFEVSPKIKTELRRLFTKRSRQTKQKQKSLLEKLVMKISKRTWAYRSAQYVCQRWLAVLFIILMICLIVPVKKQESVSQAIVQQPPVVATNAPQVTATQPVPVPVPVVFIPVPQTPTIVTQTQTVYVPTAPAPTVQTPPAVTQVAAVPEPINRIEISAQEGGYEVVVTPGKEAECFFPNGYDITNTNARSKFRNTETYGFKINGKPADRNIPQTDEKIRSLGFHNTGDTDLVINFTLVKTPEKLGLARKVRSFF